MQTKYKGVINTHSKTHCSVFIVSIAEEEVKSLFGALCGEKRKDLVNCTVWCEKPKHCYALID